MNKTKFTKKAIIALVLFLLLVLTINNIEINIYQMTTDKTVMESKWKNIVTQSEILYNMPNKYSQSSISRVDKSSKVASSLIMPIVLVYEDLRIGDTLALKPIIIDVSKENFGSLWVPLVKIGSYDIRITLKKDYQSIFKNSSTKININGIVRINGHYKIIGLCSTKKAKNLVVNKILTDLYEEVKKGLNKKALNAKKIT